MPNDQKISEFKTNKYDIFESNFATHTIHSQSITADGKVGSFIISKHYEDGSFRSDYSFRVTLAPNFLALSGDIGELVFPHHGVNWLTQCLPGNDKHYIFEKLSRDIYESICCFDIKQAKGFVEELQNDECELTEKNIEQLAEIKSFLNGVEPNQDIYDNHDWHHVRQEFFNKLDETGLVDEMPRCKTVSSSGLVRLAALRCFCRLYLSDATSELKIFMKFKSKLTVEQKKKLVDFYFKSHSIKAILETDNDIGNAYDQGDITSEDIEGFLDACYEVLSKSTP